MDLFNELEKEVEYTGGNYTLYQSLYDAAVANNVWGD